MEAIDITKYGLKPVMSPKEVQNRLNEIRASMEDHVYKKIAGRVYNYLLSMPQRSQYDYRQTFKTDAEIEIFIVFAFRFTH